MKMLSSRCSSGPTLRWLPLLSTVLLYVLASLSLMSSVSPTCELSFADRDRLYNYSLASPLPNFPHGARSEDGFYKVVANDTVLWFQLCDGMIFNHDPPICVDCASCGGPSRCGMECSALVADDVGGYPVCTTVGHVSRTNISVTDQKQPQNGVTIKMLSTFRKTSCSLSVSIICDPYRVQGPTFLKKSRTCDYDTVLRHPSGCAKVIYLHGHGWGWFGILLLISICLFGGYLLTGTVYRYFFLGVRGIDVIPNLEVWSSLPHRTQTLYRSLVQKVRGPSQGSRSSYNRVSF